jgi:sporulation-control protein spo0M
MKVPINYITSIEINEETLKARIFIRIGDKVYVIENLPLRLTTTEERQKGDHRINNR